MKILKIITIIAFPMLLSCQNKQTKKMEKGFVIQDSKLYYDTKELALGMPIEKFTDAIGMYDRIAIDSLGGFTNRTWYWEKLRGEAYENEANKIVYVNPYIDDENEKEYNSIEELVKTIGKYDSIKEEKTTEIISKYFIWDELGIILTADTGNDKVIGKIILQTLHPTKFEKLDLGLVKTTGEKAGIPLKKEEVERRKKDMEYVKSLPKKEYSGNFTYNGKTITIKEIGYAGWGKAIKELGISGSDFDPPGDSPAWSRWIRETNEMYITLDRFSNAQEYEELSPQKVGDFDCIQSIEIWNYENYKKLNE